MKTKMIALSIAVIFALIGCMPTPSLNRISMGMVADVGGIKDQSFNQSAWEGLQKAGAEFQMDISYVEAKKESDYQKNIQSLIDSDQDLIWGIGFKMQEDIRQAAIDNPNRSFALIDHDYGEDSVDNLLGVVFKAEEASYLMGVIAAKMTKTKKVGFVGGMDVPAIHRFLFGFLKGIEDTDCAVELRIDYTDAFDSPEKGKESAHKLYREGVDLIFHAAGDTGNGVIEAAKESDKMVIGVDKDQYALAPDHVISSAVKRIDLAMYEVAKELGQGNFEGGRTLILGLKESGVDIAQSTSKHVPADVLQYVQERRQQIIDGEIKVPASEEEYRNAKN
ncbi:MAG: BMP family ABC transporter substrate-binding protein [Bacillota bacterium]|nr:BMP family ABC transporter substrate-binding protein [Bacillota bacterium]